MNKDRLRVISGFHRRVNEICALLGFYAARIGILLPKFRDSPIGLTFKGQANQVILLGLSDPRTWTDRLSQNVSKKLPEDRRTPERMMTKIEVLWDMTPRRMEKVPNFRGYMLKTKATSSPEK